MHTFAVHQLAKAAPSILFFLATVICLELNRRHRSENFGNSWYPQGMRNSLSSEVQAKVCKFRTHQSTTRGVSHLQHDLKPSPSLFQLLLTTAPWGSSLAHIKDDVTETQKLKDTELDLSYLTPNLVFSPLLHHC